MGFAGFWWVLLGFTRFHYDETNWTGLMNWFWRRAGDNSHDFLWICPHFTEIGQRLWGTGPWTARPTTLVLRPRHGKRQTRKQVVLDFVAFVFCLIEFVRGGGGTWKVGFDNDWSEFVTVFFHLFFQFPCRVGRSTDLIKCFLDWVFLDLFIFLGFYLILPSFT